MKTRPPLYTILVELAGWTMDRTADIPKSHRFTFGQRLDNLALDAVLLCVRAIYSDAPKRSENLREMNLKLEEMRVLWRLMQERGWVSQQQLLFANNKIDEAGRMAGGWLKQTETKKA